MRTTITHEPDVDAAVRRLMRERRLSLKEAVNEAIRLGLAPRPVPSTNPTTAMSMGEPMISLDKALLVAARLEDDELARKLSQRK